MVTPLRNAQIWTIGCEYLIKLSELRAPCHQCPVTEWLRSNSGVIEPNDAKLMRRRCAQTGLARLSTRGTSTCNGETEEPPCSRSCHQSRLCAMLPSVFTGAILGVECRLRHPNLGVCRSRGSLDIEHSFWLDFPTFWKLWGFKIS